MSTLVTAALPVAASMVAKGCVAWMSYRRDLKLSAHRKAEIVHQGVMSVVSPVAVIKCAHEVMNGSRQRCEQSTNHALKLGQEMNLSEDVMVEWMSVAAREAHATQRLENRQLVILGALAMSTVIAISTKALG